jgi:hypothetical protein
VKLASLKPFRKSPEARRLALIFAIVYFAQGMWYLPNLSITFLLKDTFGLSAAQTATFFSITVTPRTVSDMPNFTDFNVAFMRRLSSVDARSFVYHEMVRGNDGRTAFPKARPWVKLAQCSPTPPIDSAFRRWSKTGIVRLRFAKPANGNGST